MPFKSQKQRGWMYENKPEMAKEFEAATPKDAKLPMKVKMAEGGEVEADHKTMLGEDATLVGLRDMLRKAQAGENIHEQKQDFNVNASTKNYAGGGMVHPLIDPTSIPAPEQPMTMPPQPVPSLSDTASALNQTPDTNYDFYGQVGADQRKALYDQLLHKQTSPGNMVAQAAGGIGDAISNSFGGQHNKFQDETRGIAEQNTTNRIGAIDTQRQQKLQDMQGNQEMIMNDPHHPIAEAMRQTLKGFGVNVPSGMNAGIMLKVAGPMGELALKQATLGVQEQVANQNQTNQVAERQQKQQELNKNADTEAAKHWLMHPHLASQANARLAQGTTGSIAPMTATNAMGHKIMSRDGGQTWQ